MALLLVLFLLIFLNDTQRNKNIKSFFSMHVVKDRSRKEPFTASPGHRIKPGDTCEGHFLKQKSIYCLWWISYSGNFKGFAHNVSFDSTISQFICEVRDKMRQRWLLDEKVWLWKSSVFHDGDERQILVSGFLFLCSMKEIEWRHFFYKVSSFLHEKKQI